MTIPQALKKLTKDPKVKITHISKELNISRTTIYRYATEERKPDGLDNFGMAFYLYLKYNLETDELKPYKYLLENQD